MIRLFSALQEAREQGLSTHEPRLAFASFFIDDFPLVGVAGVGKAVLSAFAALLHAMGIQAQPKKVLPEGDFTQH